MFSPVLAMASRMSCVDGAARILDEGLLQEDELLGAAFRIGGEARFVEGAGVRRRDLHGDVVCEAAERVGARDEVGLAVDFEEDADPAAGVDVRLDDALSGCARCLLLGAGDAALAQEGDGAVVIAAGVLEGTFAIHDAAAGLLTELADVLGADGHGRFSSV